MPDCPECRRGSAGRFLGAFVQWGLFPTLFYLAGFSILTYPLILDFSTRYFHLGGDGWQNVWNLWWVDKAVTELHRSPWFTHYMHHPHGTTLFGHTLNPFNGFLAIFLLPFLNLVQTHNTIVVFSYVAGGLSTFALAYYFIRSYWPSLLAGFLFTFSSYHFTHLAGHMQLIALEWVPLCFLYVYRLIVEPRPRHALLAALLLFLVLLCDYYYCFYCVLAGFLIFIWELARQRRLFFLSREYLQNYAVFVTLALVSCGPIFWELMRHQRKDPFIGAHSADDFSLEVLSPVIPNVHWRFASWTKFYWSRLTIADQCEGSVHIGLLVLCLAGWAWWQRRRLPHSCVTLFALIAVVFYGLSLGTQLRVLGESYHFRYLPYLLLQKLIPSLKLSGVPMRLIVMTSLAMAVLAGCGLRLLLVDGTRARPWLVPIVLAVFAFECWPSPMLGLPTTVPAYVETLRGLPRGAVLDNVAEFADSLYYATQHEQPLVFGYVSRTPSSVAHWNSRIHSQWMHRAYDSLRRDYHMHYWVTREKVEHPLLRELYDRDAIHIYEFLAEPAPRGEATARLDNP
jgi:hypothetical protein